MSPKTPKSSKKKAKRSRNKKEKVVQEKTQVNSGQTIDKWIHNAGNQSKMEDSITSSAGSPDKSLKTNTTPVNATGTQLEGSFLTPKKPIVCDVLSTNVLASRLRSQSKSSKDSRSSDFRDQPFEHDDNSQSDSESEVQINITKNVVRSLKSQFELELQRIQQQLSKCNLLNNNTEASRAQSQKGIHTFQLLHKERRDKREHSNPERRPITSEWLKSDRRLGFDSFLHNKSAQPQQKIKTTKMPQSGQGASNEDSIQTILTTLMRLEQRITQIDTKISAAEVATTKLTSVETKIKNVETKLNNQHKKIKVLADQTETLIDTNDKMEIMEGIIIRQDQQIKELTDKIAKMEAKSLKNNIVISGLDYVEGEDCVETVTNFLSQKLKLTGNIAVRNAYRVGAGQNRAMIVTLANQKEKTRIFITLRISKVLKTQRNVDTP